MGEDTSGRAWRSPAACGRAKRRHVSRDECLRGQGGRCGVTATSVSPSVAGGVWLVAAARRHGSSAMRRGAPSACPARTGCRSPQVADAQDMHPGSKRACRVLVRKACMPRSEGSQSARSLRTMRNGQELCLFVVIICFNYYVFCLSFLLFVLQRASKKQGCESRPVNGDRPADEGSKGVGLGRTITRLLV